MPHYARKFHSSTELVEHSRNATTQLGKYIAAQSADSAQLIDDVLCIATLVCAQVRGFEISPER